MLKIGEGDTVLPVLVQVVHDVLAGDLGVERLAGSQPVDNVYDAAAVDDPAGHRLGDQTRRVVLGEEPNFPEERPPEQFAPVLLVAFLQTAGSGEYQGQPF